MEANESSGLSSSYYHHHHHHHHQQQQQQPPPPPQITTTTTTASATATSAAASPNNGIGPNPIINNAGSNSGGASAQMVYSHAVPSAVSTPLETVKRKRGRPRKYGTPEQAAAAKRLAALASSPVSPPKKKYQAALAAASGDAAGSSSKKSQVAALGNAGQGFTPHIITVNAGEDVGQKIMLLMQQSKREICVLSASGSVSNASLRQPATSGGNITYEGRFDILSLSGSYVRTELGGRTGGLSVCLSSSDGQIVGGGLGGPLTAAGPIQVIVGSFVIDSKKDLAGGMKGDVSAGKMPSPVGGASVSGINFRSPVDSSHQNIGGSQYMVQPRGMHMTPSRSMEWRGDSGHGMQQAPENGDYQHIPD